MDTNEKYINGTVITIIFNACVVINKGLLLNLIVLFEFAHEYYTFY